ncbi:zinc finger, C3HC4 type (RING finger) domain containing protein [Acanthamoeba castellanii str. Neff]|uniref:Zinc finger, C3HC4 type (RING finger) domain containing protein n=1 Tax=Acanthamoeba castellanii (strain ATCC 30010 / Neff) TaxID=1257118 RepID=L8H6S4_ACACF|nr:zinc finger, C3HC4 type (RING finger) domain containing protein [Acanthamoeba castellanii str. Neff]ELR20850.1 zinc finger, C3HC4 type (RING finger) domain containing protein [Acanthamoeba castellanii str. Neff]
MEGEVEEASVCAICLDKAGNQGPQGTGELNGCSHIFCYSCILEWSNVANSCPLCKQKFTRVTQSQGSVQRVVRVQEREQQHEYDVHAAYGDDEEAANNSFIDDRSDAEIEREQAEGADDGDELHWLQSEQERWDRRQGGLPVADHDDTGMAVFSQDGRRLRNTRARKKREAETKRMSQEEAEAAAVLHRGGEGRERKRPRMTRQSTIAEVLEARQQNRRILQQRFTQETSNSNSNNEVVLIGDGDDEEESESNNEHQPSPSSSGGSLSSGSSEQYTPTQLWVVNATEKARAERSAANATITDYFASPQQQESANAGDSQCTPARSPIQLSPVASSDPTTASLSSCFPLTRSLGLAPSSQSTPTAAVRRTKKSAASSASQRGPQRRKSARSDDKENRPNQVSEQYIVEERNNGLAKKSLCLTPRRKRKIRHLVEQELERFDR